LFQTITSELPKDTDYPERQFRLDVFRRVLKGELYDHLKHGFYEEKNGAGEYIPLRQRRPCVKYNISKIVVDDSVSLLFSEGHFPDIESDDEDVKTALAALVKESKLNELMVDAATRGSVGSVAIFFQVLKNRVFFTVMDTPFLTPEWDPEAPDTLSKVTERYKVKGNALADCGYTISDNSATYWFTREWTAEFETYYQPQSLDDASAGKSLIIDETRTVQHKLGFVPIVWVKNLPGGEGVDGACTFKEAIDTQIEIDYQLSQAGRGLKYSSDPTLLIKEPTQNDGTMVKGAANAIVVSQDGDAKLLEIDGTAATAVVEFVKALREFALETIHGNRSNAEKISVAQSGRAMEMMNQALIMLADRLRISYAEGALLNLLTMVIRASHKFQLVISDKKIQALNKSASISLRWPAWYPPTSQDQLTTAQALKEHTEAGHMSHETATRVIAADYDIEDVDGERKKIEKQKKEPKEKSGQVPEQK